MKEGKINRFFVLTLGAILLIMVIIFTTRSCLDQTKIDRNLGVTEGTIQNITKMGNNNIEVVYSYVVKGHRYKGTSIAQTLHKCLLTKNCIGQVYKVEYAKNEPELSRIVIE